MAGIYVHIPFCKQACYYCNFHFSTQLNNREAMVAAICKDIDLRHNYLTERKLNTLYFGGGTPSLLNRSMLASIIDRIHDHFEVEEGAELTFECNPDDITPDYLTELRSLGINRLSLGIQSFFDADLQFMHRAHSGTEALKSLELIKQAGFDNISLDLIYGSPTTTDKMWQYNVQSLIDAGVPHISAYCLTIEDNTVFGRWHKQKRMEAIDDEKASRQFYYLLDALENAGYHAYEISNFAMPGFEAVHNSNYWSGVPYLGVGPSAHSYNGKERQWCVANNARYLKSIDEDRVDVQNEVLTRADLCNEMIMTRLRTSSGLDIDELSHHFGDEYTNVIIKGLDTAEMKEHTIREGSRVRLSRNGKMMADRLASSLFIVESD
ncbi:MAG: radical SAM family heme chaperone HemW [Saprospiraceae bacterium]|nr:radical SAM family heme chaperone HemW [Saprospiraceae bacterium]